MFPLPLVIYFEIIAFIVSVFSYAKIKDKPFKWFIFFLFVVIVVELLGRYISRELHHTNIWLYNIFLPIEYLFYVAIFYLSIVNTNYKKIAIISFTALLVFCVVNILFIQGFQVFNTNILIFGSCTLILLSCFSLIDIFQMDDNRSLLKQPLFWLATGILFFNLGELAYNLFFNFIISHQYDKKALLFSSINSKLMYVLYTFISIAIICTKRTYQKI